MSVRTRFAPSPTGRLHVGNIRTAIVTWLFAHREPGGHFLLRLDDTDLARSTAEFAASIETDLAWLGLSWDDKARQSDRLAAYDAAIERLKAAGRLYPAYETPEELGLKRKALLAQGKPPLYDRAALRLTDEARAKLEAEGRRPHWRFQLKPGDIRWEDRVRGPVHFRAEDISDPILIREDGSLLYTLCTVVDDIDFAMTDIVRGEDHVANTAVHVQIFEALGAAVPRFAHLPLLVDAAGEAFSKRLGSLSVDVLRDEEGLEPITILAFLARLGTSDSIAPAADIAEIQAQFDLGHVSRATPRFDLAELRRLNARQVHGLELPAVAERLTAMGVPAALQAPFWLAVRGNLTRVSEAADWWQVVQGPLAPSAALDSEFTAEAARLLPEGALDATGWKTWTAAVQAATGRKGKALFLPLRQALTGHDHGPEMAALLPLIGRERALARLAGEAA